MSKAGLIARFITILLLASVASLAAADDLYKISKALIQVYEKPDLDISRYNAVMIDTLGVADARIIPPPWVEGKDRNPKKWQLNSKDIQWLKDNYRAAMKEQIEAVGGYAVVSEPRPEALIVDVKIVSLTPYAQRDEDVITRGTGEMTIQAELRDSMTRELLAIYEGDQDVGSEYQQNARINKEHNVNALFAAWGEKLRRMMDESRM
jgi:hypothetical protein